MSGQAWFTPRTQLFTPTTGKKGLLVAEPSNSDFAMRMHTSGGRLFWTAPEALPLYDYAFATGKAREASEKKVDWMRLLEAQNGGQYGPVSIKSSSEEVLVSRTNLGIFHVGQPRCIQYVWGGAR